MRDDCSARRISVGGATENAWTVVGPGAARIASLPARAVAASVAATGAPANLLEAVAAVDGLIATRLEWHARLATARGADGGVHLARAAIGSVAAATTAGHGGLARRAALWAARWGVHQTPALVKLLLSDREHKVTAALATPQCLIGGQAGNLSSGTECASGAPANFARAHNSARKANPIDGTERYGGELREIVPNPRPTLNPCSHRRALNCVRAIPAHAQ